MSKMKQVLNKFVWSADYFPCRRCIKNSDCVGNRCTHKNAIAAIYDVVYIFVKDEKSTE